MKHNASDFVRAMLAEEDDIFNTLLCRSVKCASSAWDHIPSDLQRSLRRKLWDKSIRSSNGNEWIDEDAVLALGQVDHEFVSYFYEVILDPSFAFLCNDVVLRTWGKLLSSLADDRCTIEETLWEGRSPNPHVLQGMMDSGSRATLPHFIKVLEADWSQTNIRRLDERTEWGGDNSRNIRAIAAKAVGKLANVDDVPEVAALLSHRSSIVRAWAASALGEIRAPESVPELVRRLNDENWLVRSQVASALGRIGCTNVVSELVKCLEDEDRRVQMSVMCALGELGDLRAVPELVKKLQDEIPRYRVHAVLALECDKAHHTVFELLKMLKDTNEEVVWSAAQVLGHMRDRKAIPELLRLLKEDRPSVRQAAVRVLRCFDTDESIWPDIVALADTDELIGGYAKIDWEESHEKVARLIAMLSQSNLRVREFATRALRELGNQNAVPDMIPVLKHDRSRAPGAPALAGIGASDPVTTLLGFLRNNHPGIRVAAVFALGQIDAAEALPELIRLLHHENLSVTHKAAKALGNIPNEASIAALYHALFAQVHSWPLHNSDWKHLLWESLSNATKRAKVRLYADGRIVKLGANQ